MAGTEWVLLVAPDDLFEALNSALINGASEALNSGGPSRLDGVLQNQIDRVRGAIRTSGRVPLSIQPRAVPPEAVQHTLVLAANSVVLSTPDLGSFALRDGFVEQVRIAEEWLKGVADGASVSRPADPDPDFAAAVRWGDLDQGQSAADDATRVDLTTDGPVG